MASSMQLLMVRRLLHYRVPLVAIGTEALIAQRTESCCWYGGTRYLPSHKLLWVRRLVRSSETHRIIQIDDEPLAENFKFEPDVARLVDRIAVLTGVFQLSFSWDRATDLISPGPVNYLSTFCDMRANESVSFLNAIQVPYSQKFPGITALWRCWLRAIRCSPQHPRHESQKCPAQPVPPYLLAVQRSQSDWLERYPSAHSWAEASSVQRLHHSRRQSRTLFLTGVLLTDYRPWTL